MTTNNTKSHVTGKACYEFNMTDYLSMINNSELQHIFNTDSSLVFQFDEFSGNEILFRKGTSDLVHPELGHFFVANNQGFLEIYLAEKDGLHWLCYRSNNQILRTYKRKLIIIDYKKSDNSMKLFVDNLEEPISINKSNLNFRTVASDFTGITISNTDEFIYARSDSSNFSDSWSTIYFDTRSTKILSSAEKTILYDFWKDTRSVPAFGKVIFASDRLGNGFDLWEMNSDGTDPVLLKSGTSDLTDPKYSKTPSTNFDYLFQQGLTQVLYDSPINGFITQLDPCISGSISADSNMFYGVTKNPGYSCGYLYLNTIGSLSYPLTQAPYGNQPNVYDVDAHPTISNKVICSFFHTSNQVFTLAEVTLNLSNPTVSTLSILFQTSYTQLASDYNKPPSIFRVKYNKAGDRVGFNAYVNSGYTNLHGFIIGTDGQHLFDLGYDVQFVTFSPDDQSVLLKKTINNKTQLFTRDLNTNHEKNLSNNIWNDMDGDWKA